MATRDTAASDDSSTPEQGRPNNNSSQQYGSLQPQPNVLDQYSSYTYNISLYFLPAEDYNTMLATRKPVLNRSNLLMASGGAPEGSRNQRFPLDFYIDDVAIQQLQPGRGSRGGNGVVSINFKITEPNGITFLDNLYFAIDEILGGTTDSSKKQNYAAQIYLMHIKFYGYDQNGKMAQAAAPRDGTTVTDSRAIVEKFIPFRLVNITYRIANQLVEYACQAVAVQNDIGTGQGRGVIPYNVELTASTLRQAFSGLATVNKAVQPNTAGRPNTATPGTAAAPPPPDASASSGPGTVVNGLVDALNNYQRELTLPQGPNNEKIYDEFDEYDVVFTDNVIADASTQPPGPVAKGQVSSAPPSSAAARVLGSKQSSDPGSKKISAVAGTTLVQFLDQVIRSSSFIYDQQIQGYDAEGKLIDLPGKTRDKLFWYRIGVQATPKAYDRKRNDYAYKITYQVSPYLINDARSSYFPETKFRGVHKIYNYWFTGENTQVLNYQQDFNYSYLAVISGPSAKPNTQQLANFREYEKRVYQPRSNESDQGQESRVNEPSANLAERQYNASDLSKVSMTIVGDPAWVHQGEVWRGISGVDFTLEPFFSDGTINVEVEEPLFLISWNKPSDYDLNTGVTDPTARLLGGGNQIYTLGTGGGSQSYVYRAVTVTSNFSKGRFTQDIEGVLVLFPNFGIDYDARGEVSGQLSEVDSLYIETPTETARILAAVDRANQNRTPQRAPQEQPVSTAAPTGDLPPSAGVQTSADSNLDPGSRSRFDGPLSANRRRRETPVPTPAPPPASPTSGDQPVGVRIQLAADGPRPARVVFSELELRRADPELARAFRDYRSREETRIFEQQQQLLTQRREATFGPLTPSVRDRIRTTALNFAQNESRARALLNFRPELVRLGPQVYQDVPTTSPAAVPEATPTQLTNRET